MIQTDTLVTGVEKSGPFVRVTLAAPAIAPGLAPGRFVLANLGNYLRSPLFPATLDDGELGMLIPPAHPVAALEPGTAVNLVGPLGQGFAVPPTTRRLLLVADMTHLPALLPLTRLRAQAFSKESGPSIALLLSAITVTGLYPVQLLPPALEIHIATADGSAGHHGSSLELFPDLVSWADCVCVAQDPTTYPALAEIVRQTRLRPGHCFAQALVVPPMACGVGACQGCAVETAHGFKLACTDGPVFDLTELR